MDYLDLLSPETNDVDAATKARAMVAALRGQQGQAQQQQLLGSLGAAFHNPAAASVGNAYAKGGTEQYADAGKQIEDLQALPQTRLKQALEQVQLAKGNRENKEGTERDAALGDPNSPTSQIRRGLASRFGIDAPSATPGSAINDKELEVAERFQAAQNSNATKKQLKAAAAAAGVPLSDAAVDALAAAYRNGDTSVVNTLGRGGGADRIRVINRATGGGEPVDLAGNSADYKANSKSLTNQVVQGDLVDQKEQTALKNLDYAAQQFSQLRDTGSPLLNKPLRSALEQLSGDPQLSKAKVALDTAINEAAGVLRGSNHITEGAKAEVEHLFSPNATLGQFLASVDALKQDMANRHESVQAQQAETRARMHKNNAPTPKATPAASPPPPGGPKPVTGLTGDKAKRLAELRALQAKGELK